MSYLFFYTSGGNPYLAFKRSRKDSIMRKWKRRGVMVDRIKKGMYLIHDREYWKEAED